MQLTKKFWFQQCHASKSSFQAKMLPVVHRGSGGLSSSVSDFVGLDSSCICDGIVNDVVDDDNPKLYDT